MVRIELTEDDSLAAMRARNRLGIAMAAMIKMIATTINNSINENPFCFRIYVFPLFRIVGSSHAGALPEGTLSAVVSRPVTNVHDFS